MFASTVRAPCGALCDCAPHGAFAPWHSTTWRRERLSLYLAFHRVLVVSALVCSENFPPHAFDVRRTPARNSGCRNCLAYRPSRRLHRRQACDTRSNAAVRALGCRCRTVRHGAVIDANGVALSADAVATGRGNAFDEAIARHRSSTHASYGLHSPKGRVGGVLRQGWKPDGRDPRSAALLRSQTARPAAKSPGRPYRASARTPHPGDAKRGGWAGQSILRQFGHVSRSAQTADIQRWIERRAR